MNQSTAIYCNKDKSPAAAMIAGCTFWQPTYMAYTTMPSDNDLFH